MSPIYLKDGKILVKDGKIAIGQVCCCDGQCCIHTCACMCCQQVTWTLGSTQITTHCTGVFQIYGSTCAARARIKCSGYSATQDCDTDCEVVAIEYCADASDPACEWTTEPGDCVSVFAGLTAAISCYGDGEQPAKEYSLPRSSFLISSTQSQCSAQGGDYCPSLPCEEPCGLICPPTPTEWRIVDQDDDVWFMGDVVADPSFVAGQCGDPPYECAVRYILEDYPISGAGGYVSSCYPAGYRKAGISTLRLQMLGCNGTQWQDVTERCSGTFGPAVLDAGYSSYDGIMCKPGQTEFNAWFSPLFLPYGWWSSVSPAIVPSGCKCLTDPSTGLPVTYDYYGQQRCRHCGTAMMATSGSGLKYLGHGDPVKFTNRVNDDGANVWNWEDADGNYPAREAPSPGANVIIEGDLMSWRDCWNGGSALVNLGNVTINNATVGITFWANSLTVNGGRLDSGPCINPASRAVVTVGSATFNNSSIEKATVNGPCEFNAFNWGSCYVSQNGIINGDCVFNGGGGSCANYGTITGLCTFNDSSNSGTITGDCEFNGYSSNRETFTRTIIGNITGNCVFNGNSHIEGGIVTGTCTFNGNAYVWNGTITGICTFNGGSYVYNGTITGDCTFNGGSQLQGFTTITGDCEFNGTSSIAYGPVTIDGNCTLNVNARMLAGNVTLTATFNDNSCYVAGTAGTFVPDEPPACPP